MSEQQPNPTPDPAAILARLEEIDAAMVPAPWSASCLQGDVGVMDAEKLSCILFFWNRKEDNAEGIAALRNMLASDLIPLARRAVELEGENARLRERSEKLQDIAEWFRDIGTPITYRDEAKWNAARDALAALLTQEPSRG